ncbi:hypothetical protein Naga_101681g2, partial [Nannochloropsis gaditana]
MGAEEGGKPVHGTPPVDGNTAVGATVGYDGHNESRHQASLPGLPARQVPSGREERKEGMKAESTLGNRDVLVCSEMLGEAEPYGWNGGRGGGREEGREGCRPSGGGEGGREGGKEGGQHVSLW